MFEVSEFSWRPSEHVLMDTKNLMPGKVAEVKKLIDFQKTIKIWILRSTPNKSKCPTIRLINRDHIGYRTNSSK